MKKKNQKKNQKSIVQLTPTQRAELLSYAKMGDGFMLLPKNQLPSAIPTDLGQKIDSAVLIVSGSGTDNTWVVLNLFRDDTKVNSIDHHPIGCFITGSIAPTEAVIIDHASFTGRNMAVPASYLAHLSANGFGDYLFKYPPLGRASGSLAELHVTDKGALDVVVKALT
jgi:hypothetical protein